MCRCTIHQLRNLWINLQIRLYIFLKLKIRFGFGNRPKAEFYHSQLFCFGRLWKLQLRSFSAWDLFKMYVCALYVLCASPLAVMRYFMPKWFHKGFSVVMDWHFTHLTKKRRIRYGMKYIFFSDMYEVYFFLGYVDAWI